MIQQTSLIHWARLLVLTVMLTHVGSLFTPAHAHEPVFSIGPETIYEGGVGIQTEFEFESGKGERVSALHYELIYGLTPDLSLTFSVPQLLEVKDEGETEHGLGDIQLRAKYQFYKRDILNAQHKVTGIFGVKVPTGDDDAAPMLGTGTTDFLFGSSYGYESRTWYHFATVRYRLRTESGDFDPGDRLFLDAAVGYRPVRGEYLEWDFVTLLEMNAEIEFDSKLGGIRLPNVGGDTIWLGPTGLLSYRNIMFKFGMQFPVYQDLSGDQGPELFRGIFGIEYHF